MKKILFVFIALLIIICLCNSSIAKQIVKVFAWLFTLNFNELEVSIFGQIVVKYGTWILSYLFVGTLFKFLGWFNSTAMKITYLFISTIISFLLSWLFMVLGNYLLIITIVVGTLLCILLILYLFLFIFTVIKK